MTSDSDETSTTRSRVILLDGHDNYKEWLRYVRNILNGKDLYDVADGTDPCPSAEDIEDLKTWKKQDKKAYSLIDASLTQNVHDNLPSHLSEYTNNLTKASSYVLLSHLVDTYSAARGSRKAELLRIIWRTDLVEGEDPTRHVAKLKSAYSAIVAAGSKMDDEELAFAILMSLPSSYDTLVQSYYLSDHKDSASVINAIRTEWRRRDTSDMKDMALVAARGHQGGSGNKEKQYPYDENAYCEHHHRRGHATKDCRNPQVANFRKTVNIGEVSPHPTAPPPASAHIASAKSDSITIPRHAFLAHISIEHSLLLACATTGDIVVDSGATHHMVHSRDLLSNLSRLPQPAQITVGNGAIIKASQSGSLHLPHVTLDNVLLVPSLGRNLLSVGSSQSTPGQHWIFANGKAVLRQGERSLITATMRDGLFVLDASSTPRPSALLSAVPNTILFDWHRRLGHLNVRAVVQLGKEGRLDNRVDWGHVAKDVYGFQCPACIQGKGKRLPSPPSSIRANRPLYSIHVDLWGPARTPSMSGKLYFLTCYDDFTRKVHLTFLEKKSETRQALINYINLVENQLDCTIKTVRSDRGGEFESSALKSYFLSKGIEHHRTPPTAHAQNGRVERAHLTILDTVRTLLYDASLGDEFWAEAATYAVYTRNRSPCGPGKIDPRGPLART